MNEPSSRRPLKIRDRKIMKQIAGKLSGMKITPNQISVMSVFFALLSGACFLLYGQYQNGWFLLLSAVFIQCRLLCNLFDGMVAVEGGKSTPAGELYNDFPDRLADLLIIVPVGYAVGEVYWAVELGWTAGALAVMTAYTRTLCSSIGAPVDFRGPMAKQHRMALLTFACLFGLLNIPQLGPQKILIATLIVMILGAVLTCFRRLLATYRYLENKPSEDDS